MDTGNYRNRILAERLGLAKLNFQVLRRTMATPAQKKGSVNDIQAHLRHAKACQGGAIRFFNDLQPRGDCLSTRKSCKTSRFVGWKNWIRPVIVRHQNARLSLMYPWQSRPV
jgi:hypothetical protein